MSTELFRQYLDLLNEAVTQSEIDNQLVPALKELERILGKYREKIRESIVEDDRIDPPLFGPEEPPSPSGPKPRIARLPGESADEYLARVRELSRRSASSANNPFGIRPGEASISASPSTTASTDANPFTRDAQGRPIPEVPSTGGTITRTPTGTVHTAPPPSPWKLGGRAAAYTTAGLAAVYAAYEGVKYLIFKNSGYALRDLDPVDQASVKKNLKILEPFVVPDVFKTLPADIQTRIDAVLDQLKKLGMTAGGDQAAPQPVATPATPASAAAPAGEESFTDILQNANRYVKGVRESVEPVGLSEAENMARLRDLVQENLPLAAAAAEALAGPFVQQVIDVAKDLGLGYVVIKGPGSIEKLITRYRTDFPNGTAEDFWKWLVKLNIPNKAEALALGLGAAGYAFYTWFQVQATTGAAKAAVTALTKTWPAENNALKAFKDRQVRMTQAEYDALSNDDKDKIDETWIYYCSKFPSDKVGNQTCFDYVHNPKNGICTYHPDWAACKKPSSTP
jgi:hypothetical protein